MSNNNFDEIVNAMKGKKSKKEAQDYLMSQLNDDQTKKLNEVLSDRSALEKMLSSKEAKEILKRFSEGKNG